MTQIDGAAPATEPGVAHPPRDPGRVHPAWWVALVSFLTILGAAAFTAAPGLLIEPLHAEFGWSRSTVGLGLSVQLVLYGLVAPFAAALMDRFGIRPVVATALTVIGAGSLSTLWMTQPWQFVLTWGVMVGAGSGSMALAFTATVTQRWFVHQRGLVSGVLTAATASGQLVFLPLLAWLVEGQGWHAVSVTVALACAVVLPLVLLLLRDHPADLGLAPYGSATFVPKPPPLHGAVQRALGALWMASRTGTFWLLAGAFAICGATTNGLIRTHFVPSAHDHGMGITVAASLLAVVGIFDVVGTIFSGWLTDRFSARLLLVVYYTLRGIALLFLPALMAPEVELPMIFFIVFYGLDWVATVPPTLALCREIYGDQAPVVFGWVLASHQVGAGIVAWAGGLVRDTTGSYDTVWYAAGALCAGAALMSLVVRRNSATITKPSAAA
ncbi:MFS transporter [Myceligenerans crystallogenes]|uniref:MFS transporter n=1 Tax=Myceligenerans crystallogenes TaxID=316335 RepID=A0ABP4ZAZ9_9MICO